MGHAAKYILPVAATVVGGIIGGPAGASLGYSTTAGAAAGAVAGGALAVSAQDQQRRSEHEMQDATNRQRKAMQDALSANPQPVMPNASNVEQVKQAYIAEQIARRGRASTILSGPTGERLGL